MNLQKITVFLDGLGQKYLHVPDQVMDDNVRYPEVLDDVRTHVDLPPRPVRAVVENHSMFRPPHVISKTQTYLLKE